MSGPRPAPVWALLLAALIGGGGTSFLVPQIAPNLVRPDPWRKTDAAQQAEDIRAWVQGRIHSELDLQRREIDLVRREAIAELRADMPPDETRRKIRALEILGERLAREHGFDWEPPTPHFATVSEDAR